MGGVGSGDKLARGASSAQFNPATVSDAKWIEMFGEESLRKLNAMSEADRLALQEQALAEVEKQEEAVKPTPVKFRAVQDRIIVTRFEEEEKVNGLFVPDESKEKPSRGIIVAIGPGKFINGELQPPTVKVGERVVFGKYSGAEVKLAFETYVVLREEDLFLVLSEE